MKRYILLLLQAWELFQDGAAQASAVLELFATCATVFPWKDGLVDQRRKLIRTKLEYDNLWCGD